jgi:hypothetical protein
MLAARETESRTTKRCLPPCIQQEPAPQVQTFFASQELLEPALPQAHLWIASLLPQFLPASTPAAKELVAG